MKRLFSTATALFLSIALFAGGNEEYKVKKEMSSLDWIGKKVTGSHNGTISIKDGMVMVENGKITGGTLIVDMTTIIVEDIEDAETNAKLVGHLNSDDFFGSANNPTSTLKINKVEQIKGDNYTIHADLTIKGKTEKVEIPATIKNKDGKLVVVGETQIDRTKFDIKYGSGSFFDNLGDKAIDNLFTIKFKVAAAK